MDDGAADADANSNQNPILKIKGTICFLKRRQVVPFCAPLDLLYA